MHNLLKFLSRYCYIFVFLLLECVAITLIGFNTQHQGSYIKTAATAFSGGILEVFATVDTYFSLKTTNELLVAENAELRAKIDASYLKYNHKSFVYNDTTYKQQYEYIDAKVIAKTVNKRNNYMMLNKGRLHLIEKGMVVIASTGIVGVVTHASENFSSVMTVLHKDSRYSVRIQRTGLSGYLTWEEDDYRYGTLHDIPTSFPLQKGDTVVSSGFSQDIPEGIIVGIVDDFQNDGGSGFYRVKIKFTADYNKLDYVYIVRNFFREEQQSLMQNRE